VNVTDVEILLGLAFKPTIPVGFDFLDKLKAEAFVTMNLPRLDARLSTNPGRDCGNSSNSTGPYRNQTTELADNLLSLGALTLVEANVSLTVDVGVGLTIPLLPPPFGDVNLEANIFSTVFPLVTACVDAAKSFPSMSAIGAVNATALPCTTTARSNSTVYVPAVYAPVTKTTALTTATHAASTPVAVMPVHTPATTHEVGASMPAHAPAPMPKASESQMPAHTPEVMPAHTSKGMPAHTPDAMSAPTHIAATPPLVEGPPMPPHAIASSQAAHMPAPALESKPAMTQAAPMPVLATTHIVVIVSEPAHMPEAAPVVASHASNATAVSLIIPASSAVVLAASTDIPAVITISVRPADANATLLAPSGSGGLNATSALALQQTGAVMFTGAGAKVEVVWWKKMGVLAVGLGLVYLM
jgi:hypothetical protein